MGQAEPTRHVSAAARLRQPTPDLHGLHGGFVDNVRKLERSAEEMSAGGSDIGEEIRKMNELSRQSSLQSSNLGDTSVIRPSVMERMSSWQSAQRSSSSRSMDANSVTSPDPYSPNRVVWSPTATSTSASWSQLPPVPHSRHSQLQSTGASYVVSEGSMQSRAVSTSSFARRYDEIASEIQESLQHIPPSHCPKDNLHGSLYAPSEHRRSIDTFQEVQLAFNDFDGVHFSPETNEYIQTDSDGNEVRRISVRSFSGHHSMAASSLLYNSRAPPYARMVVAPPAEGMAYYPAPVPRTLNLPKRLSRLPAATIQSKRKTQLLNQLSQEAGAPAPWLPQGKVGTSGADVPRNSRAVSSPSETLYAGAENKHTSANILNLPAHVRAELFFKHRQISRKVELTSGSAVATLDSILEASATAPVNAFTDHPFAGDVRKSVYATEHKPQNNVNLAVADNAKTKCRSGSTTGITSRAVSSDDMSTILRIDYADEDGPNKLQKSRSLGNDLSQPHSESNPLTLGSEDKSEAYVGEDENHSAGQHDTEDDTTEAETLEGLDGDPVFAKPSTLLAELQVRKAQQKSRGRTAVTAFPNGMHSTLLELDAVQQVAQQKRKGQKISLAWEDPVQHVTQEYAEGRDDDVPLGVLFNGSEGLSSRTLGDGRDWDRPLGLMDRRNLEDGEPLSNRRSRLLGIPATATAHIHAPGSFMNGNGPEQDDRDDEHETLAQRARRMKAVSATVNLRDSLPVSDGFADDVLSKFGAVSIDKGDGGKPEPAANATPAPDLEEETLGQRKARLQRERETNLSNANARAPSSTLGEHRLSSQTTLAPAAYGQIRAPSGAYAASTFGGNESYMSGMHFPPTAMLPNYAANTMSYDYGSMAAFAAAQLQLQQQWMQSNSVLSQPSLGSTFTGHGHYTNGTYAAQAQRLGNNAGLGIATNDEPKPAPSGRNIDQWRLRVQ